MKEKLQFLGLAVLILSFSFFIALLMYDFKYYN